MDHDCDDVTNCFIAEREWEISAICLCLQDVEGAVEKFVFAPAELVVSVNDELVRNNTEGEEHREKHVGAAQQGFTPGGLLVDGAPFSERNYNKRHRCGEQQ